MTKTALRPEVFFFFSSLLSYEALPFLMLYWSFISYSEDGQDQADEIGIFDLFPATGHVATWKSEREQKSEEQNQTNSKS